MHISHTQLHVRTPGRGFTELTDELRAAARSARVTTGLCTAFIHHTSASLVITENADADVRRDLEAFFGRLVRDGDPLYRHDAEGPDDMPAHVRAALTQTSVQVPIVDGRLGLGTWQGLYLYEHRHAAHGRRVTFTVIGE